MEKNLHIVQDEQINSLKIKCDQISNEKDELEKEIDSLRFEVSQKTKEIKEIKQSTMKSQPLEDSSNLTNSDDIIKQLQKLTDDEQILALFKKVPTSKGRPTEQLNKLLEEYEQQKQKRKKSDDNLAKYERNMQKKLVQL